MSSELGSRLRARVTEQILREAERDVDALYNFIDPAVRKSRNAEYDSEPEHTIGQIREFVSLIESAEIVEFSIDGYADDGGDGRGNAPTAIVLLKVRYNDRESLNDFGTPWVLRNDQWYTRSMGKLLFPKETK